MMRRTSRSWRRAAAPHARRSAVRGDRVDVEAPAFRLPCRRPATAAPPGSPRFCLLLAVTRRCRAAPADGAGAGPPDDLNVEGEREPTGAVGGPRSVTESQSVSAWFSLGRSPPTTLRRAGRSGRSPRETGREMASGRVMGAATARDEEKVKATETAGRRRRGGTGVRTGVRPRARIGAGTAARASGTVVARGRRVDDSVAPARPREAARRAAL